MINILCTSKFHSTVLAVDRGKDYSAWPEDGPKASCLVVSKVLGLSSEEQLTIRSSSDRVE